MGDNMHNPNQERMSNLGSAPSCINGSLNHKYHADTNYPYGLDLLCRKFIKKEYSILELGSHKGVSTAVFASYCSTVRTIDHKKFHELEAVLSSNPNISFVQQNVLQFGKKDSNMYDFIYLDAGHNQQAVIDQLNLFLPKVKQNGLIGGHDYCNSTEILSKQAPAHHFGVRAAVDSVFYNKEIHIFPDTSWLVELN